MRTGRPGSRAARVHGPPGFMGRQGSWAARVRCILFQPQRTGRRHPGSGQRPQHPKLGLDRMGAGQDRAVGLFSRHQPRPAPLHQPCGGGQAAADPAQPSAGSPAQGRTGPAARPVRNFSPAMGCEPGSADVFHDPRLQLRPRQRLYPRGSRNAPFTASGRAAGGAVCRQHGTKDRPARNKGVSRCVRGSFAALARFPGIPAQCLVFAECPDHRQTKLIKHELNPQDWRSLTSGQLFPNGFCRFLGLSSKCDISTGATMRRRIA